MPDRPPTRGALGRAVRELRQERGLSIEALAGDASMHPTYLSGIERGHYNPTWDKLGALAAALGITLSQLAGAAEEADA